MKNSARIPGSRPRPSALLPVFDGDFEFVLLHLPAALLPPLSGCVASGARWSAECKAQVASAQTLIVWPLSAPSTTIASAICLHGESESTGRALT